MDEGLLVELVEKHPNLYNKKGKDFKDAKMRENSWEEISEIMGQPVDECQRVWRNIRDRFVRERKAAKETHSGSAATEPKWSLYRNLMFLEQHILPRKTVSNVTKQSSASSQPTSAASSRSTSAASSRPASAASSRPASAASGMCSADQASPYDSMRTIISSEVTEVEHMDEETSGNTQSQIINIVPSTSRHTVVRDEVLTTPSTRRSVSGQSKRPLKRQADDRVASAMEGMSEHLASLRRPTASQAFTNYLQTRLDELPRHKRKMAERHFLQYLDELEESD